MAGKVSEYPIQATMIEPADLIDLTKEISSGVYDSQKIRTDDYSKPYLKAFSEVLVFDRLSSYSSPFVQSGVLNFSVSDGSFGYGAMISVVITTDGSAINFNSGMKVLRNDYSSMVAGKYDFMFFLQADGAVRVLVIAIDEVVSGVSIEFSELSNDNSFSIITFSEAVYGNQFANAPVDVTSFSVDNFVAGGITNLSVLSVTKRDGSPLLGGETEIRVNYTITGTADGSSIHIVSADGFFDASGNGSTPNLQTENMYSIKQGVPVAFTYSAGDIVSLSETGTVFTSTTVTSWAGKSVSNNSIPSSENGYIESLLLSASSDRSMVGFNDAQTLAPYLDIQAFSFNNGFYNAEGVSTPIATADGDIIRLRRSDTNAVSEFSRDGGVSFRAYAVNPISPSTVLYPMIYARFIGETVTNPKILI